MGNSKNGSRQIGRNIYLVTFIQCEPGFEEVICQDLCEFLSGKKYSIYFSFSEYDIVVLVKLGEEEPEFPTKFTHEKIRDLQQVICYSQGGGRNDLPTNSALTITLLKFDENIVTEKGIAIEDNALQLVRTTLLESGRQRTQSMLLGTLGWPEVIFVQSGKNLEYLLNNVAKIAAESVQYRGLQICHTIPCVKRVSTDKSKFKFEPVDGNVVSWRISVSCSSYSVFTLGSELNQLFNPNPDNPAVNINATFGRRDLFIYPKRTKNNDPQKIDRILEILSEIRNNFSKDIISTSTDLGINLFDYPLNGTTVMSKEDVEAKKNREANLRKDFDMLIKDVYEFTKWEHDRDNLTLQQSSQLTQMVFRLQAIAATPGLESIINDMFEFVKAAVRRAKNQVKRVPPILISVENRKGYSELEEMENVFLFGLEQRIAGARLGLGHPSQAYSNLQGLGIQRILRAARAIPFGLLSGANPEIAEHWWGYAVFGYRNETFTLPSGVINLPFQDMLCPEEWWRLGHESGHAFGVITELLDNPILRNTTEKLDRDELFNILGAEPAQIIDELSVSIFEYLYCYRGNFDLYIETTWKFFDHWLEGIHNVTRLKQYLLRAVFVFFFHLQMRKIIKPRERVEDIFATGSRRETLFDGDLSKALKERAFREAHSIEGLIVDSVMDLIYLTVDRIKYSLRQVDINDVAKAYNAVEFLRSDFADLYESYLDKARYPKGLNDLMLEGIEYKISEIAGLLGKGKIITNMDNQADVFLIPLALKKMKSNSVDAPLPQRAKIAAVLSLWHLDRKWHNLILDDWASPSED